MTDKRECTAYVQRSGSYGYHCKNGFPQSAVCMGFGGRIPACLDEGLCEHLYPETGTPNIKLLIERGFIEIEAKDDER